MATAANLSAKFSSNYGAVRVQAQAIWRGPSDITIAEPAGNGTAFYGWPTLSLELKPEWADRIEARSVYANLADDAQPFAILRAVYWDGQSVKKLVREPKQTADFELILPARFVKISVAQLKAWLSEFNGLSVTIDEPANEDTGAIRRLNIQRDYVTSLFEKVWQAQNANHATLNQKWDEVWRQMTNVLLTEPPVSNFEEDFWFVDPKFKYDFQAYQPEQLVHK